MIQTPRTTNTHENILKQWVFWDKFCHFVTKYLGKFLKFFFNNVNSIKFVILLKIFAIFFHIIKLKIKPSLQH
jgi:hypothetical protein